MTKRIIFDLDNTLILWKTEYKEAIEKTIKYYNLNISHIDIDNILEQYESIYDVYKKEYFIEIINEKFNLNLDVDFMNKWIYELGFMSEYNKELEDTLSYLSKKYELVILTNWFTESQIERLKNAKVYQYFDEIYGGEKFIKPSKESYLQAIGNHPVEECIMIGDVYNIDIIGALKLGMPVIQADLNNQIKEKKDYKVFKKITELKEML